MAHLLYRIGRFSAVRPFVVIGAWIAALAIAGGSFVLFGGSLNDQFSIPGTETERVTEQMTQEIPGLTGATARVVLRTEDGSAFTGEQRQQIAAALAELTDIQDVASVVDPFAQQAEREASEQQLTLGREQIEAGRAELEASAAELEAGQAQLVAAVEQAQADGTFELAAEQFATQQAQLDAGLEQIESGRAELEAQATQLDLGATLASNASALRTVSADESAALAAVVFARSAYELPNEVKDEVVATMTDADIPGVRVDFSADLVTDVDGVLGIGEVVGVVLALIVLLTMMRAVLPAVQPIVTSLIGVAVGTTTALAFSGLVEMQSVTPVLGVMLALAVGIDYSLFIVYRHRNQLKTGMGVSESVGLANGTAGNAVVFAGATVIIALAALNVTGVPFLGIMGTVAAFSVAVAVATAVSLTPAILGLIGMRALNRRARAEVGPHHAAPAPAPLRTGRAVLALVASVVVLGIIAIPASQMRLGLPDGTQADEDSTEYQAYTAVEEYFGEGLNGTMLVTADLPAALNDEAVLAEQARLTDLFMTVDGVAAAAPAAVSPDNSFLAFQVIPSEGPSSESTEDAMYALRDLSPLDDGTVLGVAGEASANVDISDKLSDALPLYLAVVVSLSLIILTIVFRSLVVPVLATGGFVLSLFAAFGAVTAVFQWGWLGSLFGVHDPGPVLNFLPILLTGILFGLAMDYQLFITTGMREAYVHGTPARSAVVAGLRQGRAVVTAAAIIMTSVFGGFVFSHLAVIRPIGLGLALGVLFDAFVVRMVILPALMHLAGDKAWWLPGWLDRLLPNVDVEGAQLEREHPLPGDETADAVQEPAASR